MSTAEGESCVPLLSGGSRLENDLVTLLIRSVYAVSNALLTCKNALSTSSSPVGPGHRPRSIWFGAKSTTGGFPECC